MFQKDKTKSDGHKYMCKACRYKHEKKYRAANYKRIRQNEIKSQLKHRIEDRARRRAAYADPSKDLRNKIRTWQRKNPKSRYLTCHNWGKANRIKTRAHTKVQRAVKKGLLTRLDCQICSKKGLSVAAHAHHSDYTKPLEVLWLCNLHHKAWHRIFLTEQE